MEKSIKKEVSDANFKAAFHRAVTLEGVVNEKIQKAMEVKAETQRQAEILKAEKLKQAQLQAERKQKKVEKLITAEKEAWQVQAFDPWLKIEYEERTKQEDLQRQLEIEIAKAEELIDKHEEIKLKHQQKKTQKKRPDQNQSQQGHNRQIVAKQAKQDQKKLRSVTVERYQGVNNLHSYIGLHKMSKDDQAYREKRFQRIQDIYQKDLLMKQMEEDGFTHHLPHKL